MYATAKSIGRLDLTVSEINSSKKPRKPAQKGSRALPMLQVSTELPLHSWECQSSLIKHTSRASCASTFITPSQAPSRSLPASPTSKAQAKAMRPQLYAVQASKGPEVLDPTTR